MKVVALKSLYNKYRWAASPGDVVDVEQEIAEEMIAAGDAEALEVKPEKVAKVDAPLVSADAEPKPAKTK
jgi:hypothetical protein